MEIIVGKFAGFCFGVQRAIEMAEKESANSDKAIYTLGPIIHNEKVCKELEDKGIKILQDEKEASNVFNATVIIRSHGVGPQIYDMLKKNACKIIDATCPFVKKIHKLVYEHSQNNEFLIIVGNPLHPEVKGITAYIKSNYVVIETEKEAKELNVEKFYKQKRSDIPENGKICIFSQTTFDLHKYKKIVDIIEKKYYNIEKFMTICNSTEERQNEVRGLSINCNKIIIVGSKKSSNTKKLFDIAKEKCEECYFVDDLVEMQKIKFHENDIVGVSAGASTPNKFIREVVTYARTKF